MSVFCEFTGANNGDVCRVCGYILRMNCPNVPRRVCKPIVPPTLTDYKLVNGEKHEVRLFRARCVHLGERLPDDKMAKVKCRTPSFTPVYKCEVVRFCSPFDSTTDVELIKPCYGCDSYAK